MNLIVTGAAGSGKSTFVKNFGEYLRNKEFNVKLVNLDPASDSVYDSNTDVRDYVKAEFVMKEYRLGINGALIKSMEIVEENLNKVIIEGDYTLYDTPGQMEVFLYSKEGMKIIERIMKNSWTAGLFIVDSKVASSPENFVSILAQSAVVSLRTALPTLSVFNKIDIADVNLDLELVREKISEKESVLAELLEKLLEFLSQTTVPYRPLKISSLTGEGFEDVFQAVNELFCACGDIS